MLRSVFYLPLLCQPVRLGMQYNTWVLGDHLRSPPAPCFDILDETKSGTKVKSIFLPFAWTKERKNWHLFNPLFVHWWSGNMQKHCQKLFLKAFEQVFPHCPFIRTYFCWIDSQGQRQCIGNYMQATSVFLPFTLHVYIHYEKIDIIIFTRRLSMFDKIANSLLHIKGDKLVGRVINFTSFLCLQSSVLNISQCKPFPFIAVRLTICIKRIIRTAIITKALCL